MDKSAILVALSGLLLAIAIFLIAKEFTNKEEYEPMVTFLLWLCLLVSVILSGVYVMLQIIS